MPRHPATRAPRPLTRHHGAPATLPNHLAQPHLPRSSQCPQHAGAHGTSPRARARRDAPVCMPAPLPHLRPRGLQALPVKVGHAAGRGWRTAQQSGTVLQRGQRHPATAATGVERPAKRANHPTAPAASATPPANGRHAANGHRAAATAMASQPGARIANMAHHTRKRRRANGAMDTPPWPKGRGQLGDHGVTPGAQGHGARHARTRAGQASTTAPLGAPGRGSRAWAAALGWTSWAAESGCPWPPAARASAIAARLGRGRGPVQVVAQARWQPPHGPAGTLADRQGCARD